MREHAFPQSREGRWMEAGGGLDDAGLQKPSIGDPNPN